MSSRRRFLTQLAGAAGLGGLAALGLAGLPTRVSAAGPGAGIWRMPDEHGPQERVFRPSPRNRGCGARRPMR